jgi:hypothetical protein
VKWRSINGLGENEMSLLRKMTAKIEEREKAKANEKPAKMATVCKTESNEGKAKRNQLKMKNRRSEKNQ